MNEEHAELLRRHRPQLRYDSQEPYRAMACDSIVDGPANVLLRGDGSVIARSGDGPDALSLDLLADLAGEPDARLQRLDEGPDALHDAQAMQLDERYRNRVYGRVVDRGGRTWLQYWLWLYYNPKHLLGFGRHEGDWELVQVGLDGDGEPELLTYAQHAHGERRRFADAELHRDGDGLHPVVYLALFSHAAYFEAGTHIYPIGIDSPDGGAVEPLPEVVPFGRWRRWPGRWGNSTGVAPQWLRGMIGSDLGGNSPPTPSRQAKKWKRPHEFHADADERRPLHGRAGWRAGRATYPRLRGVEARVTGDEATVGYEIDGRGFPGPKRLHITVHERTAAGERMVMSTARGIGRASGRIAVRLPEAVEGPVVVRASAFNAARQRSDVVAADAS